MISVVGAVAEELVLVDVRDVEAARLHAGELVGGLLEEPDERDELFGRVVGLGFGAHHEVVEQAIVGGGVSVDEGAPSSLLDGKWWKNAPFVAAGVREDGVDAGRGEASIEIDALGAVEDALAGGGSVAGHWT